MGALSKLTSLSCTLHGNCSNNYSFDLVRLRTTNEINVLDIDINCTGYMNSVDWSGWAGLLQWTTGLEHWSTGTLEPSSVTAGYALYPCITQLRRILDSVSTWQKHGELAVSESLHIWEWPIILHMLNAGTTMLSQCWYNQAE